MIRKSYLLYLVVAIVAIMLFACQPAQPTQAPETVEMTAPPPRSQRAREITSLAYGTTTSPGSTLSRVN